MLPSWHIRKDIPAPIQVRSNHKNQPQAKIQAMPKFAPKPLNPCQSFRTSKFPNSLDLTFLRPGHLLASITERGRFSPTTIRLQKGA